MPSHNDCSQGLCISLVVTELKDCQQKRLDVRLTKRVRILQKENGAMDIMVNGMSVTPSADPKIQLTTIVKVKTKSSSKSGAEPPAKKELQKGAPEYCLTSTSKIKFRVFIQGRRQSLRSQEQSPLLKKK